MIKYYNYKWEEFNIDCLDIVKKIKKNKWDIKYVYGPPRGGCCLAVKLSHMLGAKYLPTLSKHVHIESQTLVCEDVSDTGKTLTKLFNTKRKYKSVTLFIKPQTNFIPDIYCREVENNIWITYPWEK